MPTKQNKKYEGRLQKGAYTGYYIGREGIIFREKDDVTNWYIATNNSICSSMLQRSSGDYRIEQGCIKAGRRKTEFFIEFDEEKQKQKIYGPSDKLPWM